MTKVKRLGFVRKVPLYSRSDYRKAKNLLRKKKKGETSDLVKHYIVGYSLSISHYRRSHAQRVVYFSRA